MRPGVWGLSCIASFFRTRFFSHFFDVGSILGGFWEAKTEAKIDFSEVFFRCFFRMRFGIDFGWIFGASVHENSIKRIVFCFNVFCYSNFHKIDVFEKKV